MIRLVIFDKDGVLLNLEAAWLYGAITTTEILADAINRPEMAAAFQDALGIDAQNGRLDPGGLFAAGSVPQQTKACIALAPELEDALKKGGMAIQSQISEAFLASRAKAEERPETLALGPVKQTITKLKEAGYLLAVLTNDGEDSARHSLGFLGVQDHFDMIVGYDSGHGTKPEPGGLLAICQKLDITPAQTVMVGDTSADRQAAERAGTAHFIGISQRHPDPTPPMVGVPHILPDIGGLPDLLDRLNATA